MDFRTAHSSVALLTKWRAIINEAAKTKQFRQVHMFAVLEASRKCVDEKPTLTDFQRQLMKTILTTCYRNHNPSLKKAA